MTKLLSISVVSCEDSSLRKHPTQTRIRTLLSIEPYVEPFDLKMQVAVSAIVRQAINDKIEHETN